MSLRALKSMFKPHSIAIFGRGADGDGPAAVLVRNLVNAGFGGPVLPVNPDCPAVAGVFTWPGVAALPVAPELAILTTPLEQSLTLLPALGAAGTRAALLLSPAQPVRSADGDRELRQALLDTAEAHHLRLLGPDRLGMAVPVHGLNATLSRIPLRSGHLSLLTQSSSLMRAVMSWASARGIGFSHLVSLGAALDVDAADLLDHLAQDPHTHAILMYLERVRRPRRFLSAARVAARLKPVIALKPRGYPVGQLEEAVYDAAARRVGILRVDTVGQLFNAVEALTATKPTRRNRLLIAGNSRSMGLLAGDLLQREGGVLAPLSDASRAALAAIVPPGCQAGNPVDLGDDAGFNEYDRVLERLLQEPDADGLLIVHVPTGSDPDQGCSEAIVARAARSPRLVMVSWIGAAPAASVRQRFRQSQIAMYRTPTEAVQSFIQLTDYRRNQELLTATPSSVPAEFTPDIETARRIVATALATGRDQLDPEAACALLAAYQIPVVTTRVAATPAAAAALAERMGGSVALKIVSPDVPNRFDAGGVALDLETPAAVRVTAEAMLRRVPERIPGANIEGFTVQPMRPRREAYEVTLGVRTGKEFKAGPVLYFGHGGTESQVIQDLAYALPPLNMHLARELMSRTRIYALLSGASGRAVDVDALALILIKVSQMVVDLDELVELDINPLRVAAHELVALTVNVRVAAAAAGERLAIRPYPKELEQRLVLADGRTLCLRPVLPEDEPALQALVQRLSPADVRQRFFQPLKALPRAMAARMTQLDYDREMAFVLADPGTAGRAALYGMVSLTADPDREKTEYAILLDSALRGLGLGQRLMRTAIAYAKTRGIREVFGEVLQENESMLKVNRALGFSIRRDPEDPDVAHVSLNLTGTG